MYKGYDVFFEKPGDVEERFCRVCGTVCEVERNRLGPTGWVTAMAKKDILHDYFFCRYMNEHWHSQALKLVQAIEETPSKRVAELMRLDLLDLLSEHGIQLQSHE